MKFVIDMNLSPHFCPPLVAEGWDAVHWSSVGAIDAQDSEILSWAKREQRIVLTNDLDFGTLLAMTDSTGPSVVQVRTQDVRHGNLVPKLIPLLRRFESDLLAGALLTVDEGRSRVRVLPLGAKPSH